MSDDNAKPEQPAAPAKQFSITKLYLKDISFESPRVPELFANNTQGAHTLIYNSIPGRVP